MAGFTQGFYVPGSLSSSYVQSKRNEQGSLEHDSQQNQIGISEQAAIQDLQSQYEGTIENAYAAYLANQRNIAMSNMGQGYKAIYGDLAQQNMQSSIGEARANLQNVRSEIEAQADTMRQSVHQQFEAEVANLDRVASSFEGYRNYLASLTSKDSKNTEGIFTKEESALGIDELYERLANEFSQRAKNYTDPATELSGMSYAEWITNQYGSKETDKDWYQWFLTGGYDDFMRSVTKRNQPSALEVQEAEDIKAAEEKHTSNVDGWNTEFNSVWKTMKSTTLKSENSYETLGKLYGLVRKAEAVGLTETDIPNLKLAKEYGQEWAYRRLQKLGKIK